MKLDEMLTDRWCTGRTYGNNTTIDFKELDEWCNRHFMFQTPEKCIWLLNRKFPRARAVFVIEGDTHQIGDDVTEQTNHFYIQRSEKRLTISMTTTEQSFNQQSITARSC